LLLLFEISFSLLLFPLRYRISFLVDFILHSVCSFLLPLLIVQFLFNQFLRFPPRLLDLLHRFLLLQLKHFYSIMQLQNFRVHLLPVLPRLIQGQSLDLARQFGVAIRVRKFPRWGENISL